MKTFVDIFKVGIGLQSDKGENAMISFKNSLAVLILLLGGATQAIVQDKPKESEAVEENQPTIKKLEGPGWIRYSKSLYLTETKKPYIGKEYAEQATTGIFPSYTAGRIQPSKIVPRVISGPIIDVPINNPKEAESKFYTLKAEYEKQEQSKKSK